MKVAQINVTDGGSTGKIANDIACALLKEDNESEMFVGYFNSHVNKAYSYQSKLKLRYNQIIARLFDFEDKIAISETKKIIKRLIVFKPDIIHLHNLHGYFINYKLLFNFIKNNKIKVVWTLHDCWTITGHCAYFDFNKCEKWKEKCEACPNLKNYPNSWLFDRSNKLYKLKKQCFNNVENMTIVCPSIWLANLVRQSYLNNYKIIVINNGISFENFIRLDNNDFDCILDRNKKILLGVASPFGQRKGYSDYIKLNKIIDKNKYEIVLVGVSERQIKELKKCGIVGIQKTKSQKKLAELYSLAYFFINLTLEDNFPTVNLEALACGCPIITYNTGGSVEVINEENGYVVEQGNLEQINFYINSNKNFEKTTIINSANKKYNNAIMTKRYIELYEEVLKGENQ